MEAQRDRVGSRPAPEQLEEHRHQKQRRAAAPRDTSCTDSMPASRRSPLRVRDFAVNIGMKAAENGLRRTAPETCSASATRRRRHPMRSSPRTRRRALSRARPGAPACEVRPANRSHARMVVCFCPSEAGIAACPRLLRLPPAAAFSTGGTLLLELSCHVHREVDRIEKERRKPRAGTSLGDDLAREGEEAGAAPRSAKRAGAPASGRFPGAGTARRSASTTKWTPFSGATVTSIFEDGLVESLAAR